MKLVLIILVVFIASSIAFVYIIIPNTIQLAEIVKIRGNHKAGMRSLISQPEWNKWWPSYSSGKSNPNSFRYNNFTYKVGNKYFEGLELKILKNKKVYSSILRILAIKTDSSIIDWRLIIKNSSNPIARIDNFMQADRIKGNMKIILKSWVSYLQNPEKVYGIKIDNQRVKDTLLMSTKMVTSDYPSTEDIYTLIRNLRTYIKARQANETNYPMLHVTKMGPGYETMVAIPVDRHLESDRQYVFKRMVPGNILVAEVKGGAFKVREAVRQMENFVDDFGFVSPAISFESLITERIKEKDSSKWITKIYYPVL